MLNGNMVANYFFTSKYTQIFIQHKYLEVVNHVYCQRSFSHDITKIK